jgi:hypothetical protein
MSSNITRRLVAVVLAAMISQLGCYNTYFITKNELQNLESTVNPKEVVTVQGDCPDQTAIYDPGDQKPDSKLLAQADQTGQGDETASDASGSKTGEAGKKGKSKSRCVAVPVSTSNPIRVVTEGGQEFRVTPFNFEMSQTQLVSPEYDLLLSLDQVKGAEVREFSTWKTIATIAGATVASVGTFVAISAAAPDDAGFQN